MRRQSRLKTLERAIVAHGGTIVDADMVLRSGVHSPCYVEWNECVRFGPEDLKRGSRR